MPSNDVMTKKDVQEYLKIGTNTLKKLMRRGEIPYIKLDRKLLFRKSDIEKWLESKLVK